MGKRQKPKNKTKKKRKGGPRVPKKPAPPKVQAKPRDDTLLSALRQRLKTKKKLFRTAREGGSRQEVQQILRNFNGDDEEKLRMMREVKDEVTGLRQKDAKRYLRRAVSGMSSTQSEGFMDMVQSKVPSQHRKQIQTYVKAYQKEQAAKESTKPKVNPDTVYVPQHMKAPVVQNESTPAVVPKKKKKVFKALDVHVPKLSEVSGFDRNQEVKTETKKPSAPAPALDLSYDRRMQRLAAFSHEWASQKLKEAMWQVSDPAQLEQMTAFGFGLDIPRALPIPGTEIVPQDLPIELRNLVRDTQKDVPLGPFVYREIDSVVWRYNNAYDECVKFKALFDPVETWLKSLMGTWTVASEVKEILRGLGIVSQQEDPSKFMLMCKKYRNDKTGHETVPIVPWAEIKFSKAR